MSEAEMYTDEDGATYYVVGTMEDALHLCQRLRDGGERAVAFGPYGHGGEEGYRVYLNP